MAAIAFGAAALDAQTTAEPANPPPPPPPQPQPYAAPAEDTMWQADLSFPYAFRWHTTGIVGDMGGNWMGNFLGGELSYYDGREHRYGWYSGGTYNGIPYREHLWTVNLAYRYTFPLPVPGMVSGDPSPLEAFVGGSAGVGWLTYYPNGYYNGGGGFVGGPGYSDTNKGRFDYTLVGGLQWNFTPRVGIKVAYRYIDVERAHRFYDTTRIDSGAVDAGLAFRF